MTANETTHEIHNNQFDFKTLLGSAQFVEQALRQLLRVVDQLDCWEQWHAIGHAMLEVSPHLLDVILLAFN